MAPSSIKREGWEIGVGPSIVIVDEGVAKNLSSTTIQKDVYAFIFDQKGLMPGLGIQGTKVTRIDKQASKQATWPPSAPASPPTSVRRGVKER